MTSWNISLMEVCMYVSELEAKLDRITDARARYGHNWEQWQWRFRSLSPLEAIFRYIVEDDQAHRLVKFGKMLARTSGTEMGSPGTVSERVWQEMNSPIIDGDWMEGVRGIHQP